MDARHILPGLLAMAASAGFVLTACNKEEKTGSTNRSDPQEQSSQGTGYGGEGSGTGGAQDRAGIASERDTAFENSFYGPPGSDWRFTPGTSIYDFEGKGMGGTGSDSSTKVKSAKAGKPRKHAVHDSAKDSMRMMKDGKHMMKDSMPMMKDSMKHGDSRPGTGSGGKQDY